MKKLSLKPGLVFPCESHFRANSGLDAAEALAVDKKKVVRALEDRGFLKIKIQEGAYIMLKTLLSFSNDLDWKEGQNPIVWPSNDLLSQKLGVSLDVVKTRLRQLRKLGLIVDKPSSNGKRYGRRGKDKQIREAYGISLAPLKIKLKELEEQRLIYIQNKSTVESLVTKIKAKVRIIKDYFEYAIRHGLKEAKKIIEGLIEKVSCLKAFKLDYHDATCVQEVERRQALVEEAYHAALMVVSKGIDSSFQADQSLNADTHPVGCDSTPHTEPNKKSLNVSNSSEEMIIEIPIDATPVVNAPSFEGMHPDKSSPSVTRPLNHALRTCKDFRKMCDELNLTFQTERGLVEIAVNIGGFCGIPQPVIKQTLAELKPEILVACIAIIYEKQSRNPDEIASPAGYLRALVKRALENKLNLNATLLGLEADYLKPR